MASRPHEPATIQQLVKAMVALGLWEGQNTAAEHRKEAARLGGPDAYRLRASSSFGRLASLPLALSTRTVSQPAASRASSAVVDTAWLGYIASHVRLGDALRYFKLHHSSIIDHLKWRAVLRA